MCECVKRNEEATIAFFKEKYPTAKVNEQASLVNQAAAKSGNKLVAVSFDEYQVWVQLQKRDGSPGKSKKLKVPFVHSYCPHCGEKRL